MTTMTEEQDKRCVKAMDNLIPIQKFKVYNFVAIKMRGASRVRFRDGYAQAIRDIENGIIKVGRK